MTVKNIYNKTEAVVLANGEYPAHPLPSEVLAKAPYVVCCDGAADEYIRRATYPTPLLATEIR